jgi:hypothetical protein
MQSECLAISPNLICSYAWKVPEGRPAIFERAQTALARSGEKAARENPSIPWKAYLASREFQHLASDLAEAFFAESPSVRNEDDRRPGVLSNAAHAAAGPRRGLLAPVLEGEVIADGPCAIAA